MTTGLVGSAPDDWGNGVASSGGVGVGSGPGAVTTGVGATGVGAVEAWIDTIG